MINLVVMTGMIIIMFTAVIFMIHGAGNPVFMFRSVSAGDISIRTGTILTIIILTIIIPMSLIPTRLYTLGTIRSGIMNPVMLMPITMNAGRS